MWRICHHDGDRSESKGSRNYTQCTTDAAEVNDEFKTRRENTTDRYRDELRDRLLNARHLMLRMVW